MSEYVKIKIPNNPWILSTIILSILLIAAIITFYAFFFNGKINSISSNQVEQKVVNFLNTQVNGTVQFQNVTEISGLYQVNVLYKGQSLPVYTTKDGNYIIEGIVPINS